MTTAVRLYEPRMHSIVFVQQFITKRYTTFIFSIILTNILDRLRQFFHCYIRRWSTEILNKISPSIIISIAALPCETRCSVPLPRAAAKCSNSNEVSSINTTRNTLDCEQIQLLFAHFPPTRCSYCIWSTRNSRPRKPQPRTKHEVDRVTRCRDIAIRNFPDERSVDRSSNIIYLHWCHSLIIKLKINNHSC